ncbi:MAG: hypothetical protein WBG48_17095, partial [Pricia sp.]
FKYYRFSGIAVRAVFLETKKSPTNEGKALLREHYMKMKNLISFLLQDKSTSAYQRIEIFVVKAVVFVV